MLMVPNSWSCFAIEALWVQYGGSDFDIKTKKALGDLDERAKGRVHTCNTSLLIFQKKKLSSIFGEGDISADCNEQNMICLNSKQSWTILFLEMHFNKFKNPTCAFSKLFSFINNGQQTNLTEK